MYGMKHDKRDESNGKEKNPHSKGGMEHNDAPAQKGYTQGGASQHSHHGYGAAGRLNVYLKNKG